MKWRKLGQVTLPPGAHEWMHSHASLPTPRLLGGSRVRVFFSSRDKEQRSHIAYADIDLKRPGDAAAIAPAPLLGPGKLGAFDDSGAMLSWIVPRKEGDYFYYIGWNLGVTVPFRNSVGIAVQNQEGRLTRLYEGPVLDRTAQEPHFTASCCVLVEGGRWRMWYLSCMGWTMGHGKPRHNYHIKYAESDDGIHWDRRGTVCIDFSGPQEYAISRPCVVRDTDRYRMWYSYRGDRYRIGYAESADGIVWKRLDHLAGIDVSSEGWDSQMIEYPYVFDYEGERYMLYNGNDYGRTGFGIAVLDKP